MYGYVTMHSQQNIINVPILSYVIMACWLIKYLEIIYFILSPPNNFLSTLFCKQATPIYIP